MYHGESVVQNSSFFHLQRTSEKCQGVGTRVVDVTGGACMKCGEHSGGWKTAVHVAVASTSTRATWRAWGLRGRLPFDEVGVLLDERTGAEPESDQGSERSEAKEGKDRE